MQTRFPLRFVRAVLGLVVSAGILTPGQTVLRASSITLEPLRRDGYGVVPLKRPTPNVLVVPAQIDGRKEDLLVDTGWSGEGINLRTDQSRPSSAEKDFGVSASGKKVYVVKRDHAKLVKMGDVELAGVPLAFAPFKLPSGTEGVFGPSFLQHCSAILDLHNLRLYLRPPGKGHRVMVGQALQAAGLSQVPLLITPTGGCYVDVQINGFTSKMIVDTGAWLTTVDSVMASKIGLTEYKSHTGYLDASGALNATTVGRLRALKIGGVNVRAENIRMAELGLYARSHNQVIGALGMDILGRNGAIIDFGQQKLYIYQSQ